MRCDRFFGWYNHEHSAGIGPHTPMRRALRPRHSESAGTRACRWTPPTGDYLERIRSCDRRAASLQRDQPTTGEDQPTVVPKIVSQEC